jgi:FkbM family methyltransferase
MSASAVFTRPALWIATRVYRATPSRRLREAYFQLFLRLVRRRRVTRQVEGMWYELDLTELIDVGIFLEQYERDVVALIERLTRPGFTVLDIGANIGAHAVRFSKLVGPTGHVYAFEPMEYAYTKLVRNLSLNNASNTKTLRLALSDAAVAQQQVHFRSSWTTSGRRQDPESSVEMRRLDDWARAEGVDHVDLIKLDVDGFEYRVLAGGRELIARTTPVILIEAGAWHFTTGGNPLRLLSDLGYGFRDAVTLEELSLEAIRRRLPERDDEMALSINLVASVGPLPLTPSPEAGS